MVVIVEGYIAGGADRVLSNLLPYFQEYKIKLLYNKDLDTSVLLSNLNLSNLEMCAYDWVTPASLGARLAKSSVNSIFRFLIKIFLLIIRYPIDLMLFIKFLWVFNAIRPDVVLINNGGYPGGEACRMGSLAANFIGVRRVIHVVHNIATSAPSILKPFEWIIDRLVQQKVIFVVVSNAIKTSLIEIRKLKARIEVINNGLEASTIAYSPPLCKSPIKILQVGYLGAIKNQKLSINALGSLKKGGFKNISLTFAGKEADLGYQIEMIELAKEQGVNDNINFLGFVDNIESLYSNYDGLLLTSTVEGMPICILEAMRAGRAVISTSVGGVPEMLSKDSGYIVSDFDPESIANIFIEIIENSDILKTKGSAGRKYFYQNYLLDDLAVRYIKIMK